MARGRAVSYRSDAREAPVVSLRDRLELTATPNWGVLLRRGLLELSEHDYGVISQAMVG